MSKRKQSKKKKKAYYALIGVLYFLLVTTMALLVVLAVHVTQLKAAEEDAYYQASVSEDAARSSMELSAAESISASESEEQSLDASESESRSMEDEAFSSMMESISLAKEEETFVAESHEVKKFSGRILIGDSRTVMLDAAVAINKSDIVIAKGAMSYDWFAEEAVPRLKMALDIDPNYAVVINMGVNDCANYTAGWREYFVNDYVDLINELCIQYPTTYFYFASVGHIRNYYPSAGRYLSETAMNENIDIFNETMKNNCIAYYIDLCEYLDGDGYGWADNVHYNSECSQRIYNYIVEQVGENDGPAAILKE